MDKIAKCSEIETTERKGGIKKEGSMKTLALTTKSLPISQTTFGRVGSRSGHKRPEGHLRSQVCL